MQAKVKRIYMLVALGFTLFLLVALVGFEIFPVTNGNNDLVITQQANFQIARDEVIAKDALILADPANTNHAQAVGELQTALPQFQEAQTGLANGDPVLGLPANPPDNVRIALVATQSDYLFIAVATKAILAHPDAPFADPVQVNIIKMHEHGYALSMYQVVTLIEANAEGRKIQLLLIELSLKAGIGLLVIMKYVLFTKGAIDQMVDQEVVQAQEKEQQP